MLRYSSLFLLILLFGSVACIAQDDQSESPYFLMPTEEAAESFPLKSTAVDARITGPIADITVTQVYGNNGDELLEAIYVFPASTRAAVYHMEMHIGERIIKAEIQKKQEARKIYEEAKAEGKRASLLEQHRPNVFQMNVANIMPGEEIKVVMKYTEFMLPQDQLYTFVYPTVVGPRYTGEKQTSYAAQPYTHSGEEPSYTYNISVDLHMPIPVQHVSSKSHKVATGQQTVNDYTVRLKKEELFGGNRDFILEYSLAGGAVAAGAMTYERNGEQFFLCQIEGPQLTPSSKIVPREYIFIVDISGSMQGYPLTVSKKLLQDLLSGLENTDKFNVHFFAGSSWKLSEKSIEVNEANIQYALKKIDELSGGGGTNMLGAIQNAMADKKARGYSRSFVIVTDGYVSVGKEAFDYVENNLGKANFYAFGIGSSVNRELIEGLAHIGQGKPYIATSQDDAAEVASQLKEYIQYPMMTDIKIDAQNADLYEVMPKHIPDLMAGRPIYFFGKYEGNEVPTFEIKGTQDKKDFEKTLVPSSTRTGAALPYLWARETIKMMDDYGIVNARGDTEERITELGLAYNLLTTYTSFVAVDHEVVADGKIRRVNQPLPLPQNVSNSAIGFEIELTELCSDGCKMTFDVTVEMDDSNKVMAVEYAIEAILKRSPELARMMLVGDYGLRFGNAAAIKEDWLRSILSELRVLALLNEDDFLIIKIALLP
ncbi:MAG: Ca-activated chloride channel family protein [Litorivivens sp.]|jgi:Ca-activated chloride channel family protein